MFDRGSVHGLTFHRSSESVIRTADEVTHNYCINSSFLLHIFCRSCITHAHARAHYTGPPMHILHISTDDPIHIFTINIRHRIPYHSGTDRVYMRACDVPLFAYSQPISYGHHLSEHRFRDFFCFFYQFFYFIRCWFSARMITFVSNVCKPLYLFQKSTIVYLFGIK